VIILLCGGLLMLSALPATKARAQSQPSTGKFRRVGKPIPNQYIVVLDDNIPGSEVASRAAEMAFTTGGSVGHVYRYALSGFSAKMSEAAAIALSLDPRVEFVEEDGEVFPGTTQSNPPSWGLDRIDQTDLPVDNAYSYTKDGTGVNVYVVDTGIRLTHQDFGGRAHFGADCTVVDGNGNCVGTGTGDQCNHGTLVASIVGGSTTDSSTSYGVAKNVTLYSVRVLNCTSSDFSTLIAGVDWVTNNHVKPAVVNMSIQGPSISTAADKSIKRSIAAGVTYIIIAGNNNEDVSLKSPSDVTQAIIVGATGNDAAPYYSDDRWPDSSFGSGLDLFAPGAGITGASSIDDTAVQTKFGTSLAAPHVAGAAAQYLQIDPTACPCMINHILTDPPAQGGVVTTDRVNNPGAGSPNKLLFVPQTWPTPTYYSLSLNGSTAYIDVPDPPSGGVPLDITGAITVEAWIKTTSTTVRQCIVERYNNSACTGTADGAYSLLIRPNGNVRFQTLKNGCELDSLDASGVNVRDGMWHHIAGVWDGSQMRIYIGGQRAAFKSTMFAPGTGTSHLLVGRGQDGSGFFNGLIDEVRVTAAAVYSGSSFTTQHRVTGVVLTRGLWRFDISSDLGRDCAQVNNGTVIGGATSSTDVP